MWAISVPPLRRPENFRPKHAVKKCDHDDICVIEAPSQKAEHRVERSVVFTPVHSHPRGGPRGDEQSRGRGRLRQSSQHVPCDPTQTTYRVTQEEPDRKSTRLNSSHVSI